MTITIKEVEDLIVKKEGFRAVNVACMRWDKWADEVEVVFFSNVSVGYRVTIGRNKETGEVEYQRMMICNWEEIWSKENE